VGNVLEIITGCMYSGKTTHYIQRVEALEKEKKSVIRLKPVQDARYSKNDIVTHDGVRIKGLAVDEVDEIIEIVQEEACDVLAVDEVQFFGWDFVRIANELANDGVHVLVAGVDLDFAGRPFGIMPDLMAHADKLTKLNATCTVCGKEASRSQRLRFGQPVSEHDPIFATDEHTTYESRCRRHHEVTQE
jgi:thymidine kinase